jgi:DNA-binding transcriptional LysR family regulator
LAARRHLPLHEQRSSDQYTGFSRGWVSTDSILICQAAIQGQGIAIGRSALVDDALTQGLLVRPFEIMRPADFSYWTVMTPGTAETRAAGAFWDWLVELVQDAVGVGRAPQSAA